MLHILYDHQVYIKRLTHTNDISRTSTTATADVALQPLSKQASKEVEGIYGRDYQLYGEPDLNIKEGDRVYSPSLAKTFDVKTVIVRSDPMGLADHTYALLSLRQ